MTIFFYQKQQQFINVFSIKNTWHYLITQIIKIYKIESEIKTKMRFYQLENKVSCLRDIA